MESPRKPLDVTICTGELISASATRTVRADWRKSTRSAASGSEVITRARPLESTCWKGQGDSTAVSGLQSSLVLSAA